MTKKELEEDEQVMGLINERLDFLPENSVLLLPFLQSFLAETGLSSNRVEEIIVAGEQTEEEEDILITASNAAHTILEMLEDDDEEYQECLYEEAFDLASEYVPKVNGRVLLE